MGVVSTGAPDADGVPDHFPFENSSTGWTAYKRRGADRRACVGAAARNAPKRRRTNPNARRRTVVACRLAAGTNTRGIALTVLR